MKSRISDYIIPMFLLVIFSSLSIQHVEINDLVKHRLSGKIRSVMEIKYSIPDDDTVLSSDKNIYQKYTFFNQEGYEKEMIIYKLGEEYLRSDYYCSSEGKPVEMREYKSDGTLNLHVTYKYDEKGNKIEALYDWGVEHKLGEICENSDYYFEVIQSEPFIKVVYTNEYRGFCIAEDYIKADGNLSFRFSSKYDIHGNKLESNYYHGNKRLSWRTKYKYDRYNNLIESQLFKSNRIAVFSTYEYRFDEAGNWTFRKENREVHVNILTAGLDRNDMVTERIIEYY